MIPIELFDKAKEYCSNYIDIENLKDPKSVQEKLCWLKLYDNCKLKTICADKIKLHDYSKWLLGKDLCIPILKVYDSPDDIDLDQLPNQFVLKCNHGSEYNIIVRDKNNFDLEDAKKKLKRWLSQNYGARGFEFQYYEIERKCFAEEFKSNDNFNFTDYKFWCSNGEPKFVEVITDRSFENRKLNCYDMDFKFLDFCRMDYIHNNPNVLDKPPPTFNKMKYLVKKLSFPFKFVRVDLYQDGKNIYLGELTFIPANCKMRYKDPMDSYRIGNMIEI